MVFLIIYVDFYFYIVDHHGFSVSRCAWFFSLIFTKDCSCICVADLMNFYAFDLHLNCLSYTVCPKKSEPPKHFATVTANLHRFKWNFTHTRRHLFLSSTSNSVYEMFNSFKLLSQISVTDTTYFLLTSSVVTGVTSVRVDKQTTCYQKRIEF